MISNNFLGILSSYGLERAGFNQLITLRKKQKQRGELDPNSSLKVDGEIANILTSVLPSEINLLANLRNKFKIVGSPGIGYMAEVPHVCIFDTTITSSAQKGYYLVYLFDVVGKTVYLSLNQGYTEYTNAYKDKQGKIKILENSTYAQKLLRSVEGYKVGPLQWAAKGRLANGYNNGNICCKVYHMNGMPDDGELINDLRDLIGVYKELKGLVGPSIFNIQATISETVYQAEIQGKKGKQPPDGPIPKKESKTKNTTRTVSNREQGYSAQALINAKYLCENDSNHQTFPTKFGHQFVEAHHFIPLEFTERFNCSLDMPENILSLCPNCHRAFHHSTPETKNPLIFKFLELRKPLLISRGITITADELSNLYNKVNILEEEII